MEISEPRRIISRMELVAEAGRVRGPDGAADEDRSGLKDLLSKAMEAGRAEIRSRFDRTRRGLVTVREHAYLVDQLLAFLHDEARARRVVSDSVSDGVCVVAVGGYGRAELCPQSDVDLLFLTRERPDASVETLVQFVLYALWDLGLVVGHATRSVPQCLASAHDDWTVATSLLDARYVYGDQGAADLFRARLRRDFTDRKGREFLAAKLEERDRRHSRMADSRYMVEPNLKEGPGGLRDLQLLGWISKFLYGTGDVFGEEAAGRLAERGLLTRGDGRAFARAADFLFAVRCCLHWETERGEDRITFDLQPVLAERFGYRDSEGASRTERFMKHYFLTSKRVSEVAAAFLAGVGAEQEAGSLLRFLPARRVGEFAVRKGRLSLPEPEAIDRDPRTVLRAFETACERGLDLHPSLRSEIRSRARVVDGLRDDPEAGEILLRILTAPKDIEPTLREMSATGVLGRLVPEFGRVVAQNQHDMYHVYTVDEHTIRALAGLSALERGEGPGDLAHVAQVAGRVQSRRVLYLALLLHDIGKGRGGEHAEVGAVMARGVCARLGIPDEEAETVVWLVEHHLYLAEMSFKRAAGDPKTVADIVARVQLPERLRLLYVLTACDISAIGPSVWTAWKASLLEDSYETALAVLSSEGAGDPREVRAAEMALDRIDAAQGRFRERVADWPEGEADAFIERSPPQLWVMHEPETAVKAAMVDREARAGGEGFAVDCRPLPGGRTAEVIISAPDDRGLFARAVTAILLSGMAIVDAKILTTRDGMALDTFAIELYGNAAFDDPRRLETLAAALGKFIAEKPEDLQALLDDSLRAVPSRTDVFKVAPSVLVDNEASQKHTVMEIVARDRPGLLAIVAVALFEQDLAVFSARVTIYGEKATGVLYVQTLSGGKLSGEERIGRVRAGLLAALSAKPEGAAPEERAA